VSQHRSPTDVLPAELRRVVEAQSATIAALQQQLAAESRAADQAHAGADDRYKKLERKVTERQGRLESALMQVASRVDLLG